MKSKLIITGLCVMLVSGGYVFAHEGHEDSDDIGSMTTEHGSMMEDKNMMQPQGKEGESKAIEVGNKICPVSRDKIPAPGEKGEMGEAVKYEYNGKIYNLCCLMCIKDFKKNPEKYSKIAEDEVKKAKEQTQDQKNNSK